MFTAVRVRSAAPLSLADPASDWSRSSSRRVPSAAETPPPASRAATVRTERTAHNPLLCGCFRPAGSLQNTHGGRRFARAELCFYFCSAAAPSNSRSMFVCLFPSEHHSSIYGRIHGENQLIHTRSCLARTSGDNLQSSTVEEGSPPTTFHTRILSRYIHNSKSQRRNCFFLHRIIRIPRCNGVGCYSCFFSYSPLGGVSVLNPQVI